MVSNAIFQLPRKADYRYLPWCTSTEPELGSIGRNETRANAASFDDIVLAGEFKDNDRSLVEGERIGKVKMIVTGKGLNFTFHSKRCACSTDQDGRKSAA
ncbi:MAG: hypothetical protein ACM3KE_01350 [Hyphomicrobiales bacterium]